MKSSTIPDPSDQDERGPRERRFQKSTGFQLHDKVGHARTFQLEYPCRVPAKVFVNERIVQRNGFDIIFSPPLYQLDAVIYDGERLETEKMNLMRPTFSTHFISIELQFHPSALVERHQLRQRTIGYHDSCSVCWGVARKTSSTFATSSLAISSCF